MKDITFNNLPQAVMLLYDEVLSLKALLQNNGNAQQANTSEWLNLTQLIAYLPDQPAKQTVYGWVHENKIPFHKGGKKLRFNKNEINQWLANENESQTPVPVTNSVRQLVKPPKERRAHV